MNEEILVSIVIPVYNVKDYLDRCVESLIGQTWKNIQIILVDDGSTDGSGPLCDAWAAKDKRITVIHKSNGGLSDARNVGLMHIKGEYLTFVDSDDYIDADYVEYLIRNLLVNRSDISICPYYVDRGPRSSSIGNGYHDCLLTPEKAIERMLNDEGFGVSSPSKMYKSSLFSGIRFPLGKLCEDNGTTYKLMMRANSIHYGSEPKYHYVIRENSIMNSFDWRKMDLVELTDLMASELLARYPQLKDAIIRRQVYARMSVLRQAVICKEIRKNDERIVNLRKYVLANKDIFRNRHFNKRDRIAYFCLKIGISFYSFAWRVYSKVR